jgi:T5SS/PEP-CTERM-associated repeat protein/autotransporter-associated beta strand protein
VRNLKCASRSARQAAVLIGAALLACPLVALGDEFDWSPSNDGSEGVVSDGAQWSWAGHPLINQPPFNDGTSLLVFNSGSYLTTNVDFTGTFNANALQFGSGNTAFHLFGSAVTLSSSGNAISDMSSATQTISTPLVLNASQSWSVTSGTLTVNGSSLTQTASDVLTTQGGGTVNLAMTGSSSIYGIDVSTLTTVTAGNLAVTGSFFVTGATMNVSGGAVFNASTGGVEQIDSSTLNVTGSGSKFIGGSQVNIGDSDTSQLIVTSSGAATAATFFVVGAGSGALSGLDSEAGGTATAPDILVGPDSGSNGTILTTGSGSTVNATSGLFIGGYGSAGGTGNVNIFGGSVNAAYTEFEDGSATVTVNGGVFNTGGLTCLSSGNGSISLTNPSSGYALNINGASGSYSYSGSISGSGSINKSGGSVQYLTGSDTFTGTVLVSGGTLELNSANSFPSMNLIGGTLTVGSGGSLLSTVSTTFAGGTLTFSSVSEALSGSINVTSAGGTLAFSGAPTLTENGTFSGTGQLNLTGAGTLALNHSGSSFGNVNISAAVLNINPGYSATASSVTIGGSLSLGNSSSFTVTNGITNNQTLQLGTNATLTASGLLTNSGLISLSSGASVNANGINFSNGILSLVSGSTVTSTAGINIITGTVNLTAGTLAATSGITVDSTLNVSSGAILKAPTWINVSAGTMSVAVGATVNASSGINLTNFGTLSLPAGNALPASVPIILNGGSLLYTGSTATLLSPVTVADYGGGIFNIQQSGAILTVNGPFPGAGSFVMTGAGTLSLPLTGTNSFSEMVLQGGITQVSAGTLSVSTSSIAAINPNGGNLKIVNGGVVNASSATADDVQIEGGSSINVTGTGSKLNCSGAVVTVGDFSTLGSLFVTSSASVASAGSIYIGANGGTGTLTINSGGTVSAQNIYVGVNNASTGGVSVTGANSSLTAVSVIQIETPVSGTIPTLAINGGATASATRVNLSSSSTLNISGGSLTTATLSGVAGTSVALSDPTGGYALNLTGGTAKYSGTSGTVTGTGTLNLSGGAYLTLFAADTNTGQVLVYGSGSELELQSTNTFSHLTISGGTLLMDTAATLPGSTPILLDGGTFLYNLSSATLANPISLTSNGGAIGVGTSAATTLTLSSAINGSGGALTTYGPGTLTLNNSGNSFGSVTVNGGTVSLGTQGNMPTFANLTVNSGTFTTGTSSNIGYFGNISLNGGTLLLQASGPGIFTNQILSNSAGGTISFNGSGSSTIALGNFGAAITIAGNNTWQTSGSSVSIQQDYSIGNIPFNISTGITVDSTIALGTSTGMGFEILGSGTLFEHADTTDELQMNAPITVTQGTYRIIDASTNGGVGNFGVGAFTLNGGALSYGGMTATTSKQINLASIGGTIRIEVPTTVLTETGGFSGQGGLAVSGSGTLNLALPGPTALNTVEVSAATLQISSGTLTVNNGGSNEGIYLTAATLNIAGSTVNVFPTKFAPTVELDANSTVDVTGTGSQLNVQDSNGISGVLVIGSHAPGHLNVSSNAVVTSQGFVYLGGYSSQTTGTLNISGGGVLTTPVLSAGGNGSTGTITVGGTSSTLNATASLALGGTGSNGGTASLLIQTGGVVNANSISFNSNTSSANVSGGTLNTGGLISSITGGGSVALTDPSGGCALNINGSSGSNLYSGSISGTGSLNKSGGSTQILAGTDTFTGNVLVSAGALVLSGTNSFSSLNISGGTAQMSSTSLSLPGSTVRPLLVSGSGALFNITSGTVNLNASSFVNGIIDAGGTVDVTGAGSQLNALGTNGKIDVGHNTGTGTLTVANGGLVTAANSMVIGGFLSGAGGNVTISGNSTVTTPVAEIGIFNGTTGTVTISTGSTLNATQNLDLGGSSISGTNGGTGTLTLNTGVTITTPLTTFFSNTSSINISGGSLITASLDSFNTGNGSIQLSDPSTGYSLNLNGSSGTSTYSGSITGTGSLNKSGGSTQVLAGTENTTGAVLITGGTLVLSGQSKFASLVNSSSIVRVSGSGNVLSVGSLLLIGGGTLDITSDALDIGTANLASTTAQAAQAYNNGWNGSGLMSSTAAADTRHLTAIGVIQNNQGGAPLYKASHPFEGTVPGIGDILARYTYYGDANLDGKVDGSDDTLIDNGFLTHLTGWFNGDFNYDGVVNGSDYSLIDNAFDTQGAQLSAEIAMPTAQLASSTTTSVPEPATLGLLVTGGIGILRRRTGRRNWNRAAMQPD